MPERPLWRRLLKVEPDIGAYQWFIDRIRENWLLIVGTAGSGGVMTYLAMITKWLEPWGPIGWGVIGLSCALLTNFGLAVAFYIYALGKQRSVQLKYIKSKIDSSSINVLAPLHANERINLSDFFHPFYRPSKRLRFENCDLMWPCNVFIGNGVSFLSGEFNACEVVIVRPGIPVIGATAFEECQFIDCRLYRVTFVMNFATFQNLPEQFRTGLPVISDGTVGIIGRLVP